MQQQAPEALADLLAPYPVLSTVPVQWVDMDRNQHVNNVVYLRYAEVARLHFFEHINFMDFTGKCPGPILAEVECKYIFPLTYPDRVWMGTRPFELSKTDFWLETLTLSEKHARVVAKIITRVVVFDYEKQKKVEMDDAMWEKIVHLQKIP